MAYVRNKSMTAALSAIFPDYSVAEGLLGIDLDRNAESREWEMKSPTLRIISLRKKLEDYIAKMADSLEELGVDDAPRIQAETASLLVVLRELSIMFPEAFRE